jgi:preprotein translocase subunit SecG
LGAKQEALRNPKSSRKTGVEYFMLETFVTIVHVIVAVFMILVVLIQGGNSGGIGAAFGGGNSSGFFGATGATSLLGKLTYGAAAVFMVTSISLTVMQGKSANVGLTKSLEERQKNQPKSDELQTPAATATPSASPSTDK